MIALRQAQGDILGFIDAYLCLSVVNPLLAILLSCPKPRFFVSLRMTNFPITLPSPLKGEEFTILRAWPGWVQRHAGNPPGPLHKGGVFKRF